MKSYDIVEWGKPLQEVLRDRPKPVGTEVLVKVQACGICHSDLHIRDGLLDLGNGKHISFESVGVKLPFTMGHEIVGVVAEAGSEASVKAGTPCVVYPWHGCGTCLNCTNGREVDCESGRALGTRKPGGYSDYVVVPHEQYLLDYGNLDPLLAATCACSGLTSFSALKKLPPMLEADTLVLIGAGGLGLAALGLAPQLTSARLVVADIDDEKLARASAAGAHEVVNLRSENAARDLRKAAPNGIRAIVDFVGSAQTTGVALESVARGGTVVVVGLFGGAISLSTALLPMRNVTLRGSYVGSVEEMRALLDLLQEKGKGSPVNLKSLPMSAVNEALEELAQGRVAGRLLAIPGQ
ncbi:alcohol dehydrogenase [Cupriavidus metallidurans]|uniref:Alcohol dehydrogenase, NAD-dependent, Zn-containing n=1 Tax=Cupriavidus metallidurans (strain ATCC 43123 / DSM 2839 / NBRC 102507 / CH34) TaxID=266264 RepID=Q1LBS2_CUPMC|nr:alcohol dehydrogenase [Cupriavidus metallidurans]ABF12404.1 Alcohol dehydrogenase, NAD-dependent, Zn-containing [Cupriavidus metallidurans CH34]QGS32369.1 alcohol dehydrogenase catalytic domain-containing protein [Cupriavidus metallidurans]